MTFKREHVRFKPDPNTLAWISTKSHFTPEYVALVENESYKGCGLITNQEMGLKEGATCYIACGKMSPMKAEIRWIQALTLGVYRIGLRYK